MNTKYIFLCKHNGINILILNFLIISDFNMFDSEHSGGQSYCVSYMKMYDIICKWKEININTILLIKLHIFMSHQISH